MTVRSKAPPPATGSKTCPFTVTARAAEAPELPQHVSGEWVQTPLPLPAASPKPRPSAPTRPKPRRFWGIVVLLLGLVITFMAGIATDDWGPAIIVWIIGLVLTIVITRRVWRRRPARPRRPDRLPEE
jgi:hypothetical protein